VKRHIRVTGIGSDHANDSARYRVEILDERVVEARISLTRKARVKPSPEEKITEWFARRPLPEDGTVIDIPDTDLVDRF
jgi:hypothetical protein